VNTQHFSGEYFVGRFLGASKQNGMNFIQFSFISIRFTLYHHLFTVCYFTAHHVSV
jgi:hypothetical protein